MPAFEKCNCWREQRTVECHREYLFHIKKIAGVWRLITWKNRVPMEVKAVSSGFLKTFWKYCPDNGEVGKVADFLWGDLTRPWMFIVPLSLWFRNVFRSMSGHLEGLSCKLRLWENRNKGISFCLLDQVQLIFYLWLLNPLFCALSSEMSCMFLDVVQVQHWDTLSNIVSFAVLHYVCVWYTLLVRVRRKPTYFHVLLFH